MGKNNGNQNQQNQNQQNNNNNNNKPGGQGKLYSKAINNVMLQLAPQVSMYAQQMQQAQQNYLNNLQAMNSAYGGYQQQLGAMPTVDYGGLASKLTGQLQGLGNLYTGGGVDQSIYGLPVGMPGSEIAAGQGLAQTLGSNAMIDMNTNEQRGQAWREGLGQEGALAQRWMAQGLQQDMKDTLQTYGNQLSNIMAQTPAMIKAEKGTLRQEKIENQLAKSQMTSDAAFNEWLQGYLGGQVGGTPGPGGKPGPGGTVPTDSATSTTGTTEGGDINWKKPPQWLRNAMWYAQGMNQANEFVPGLIKDITWKDIIAKVPAQHRPWLNAHRAEFMQHTGWEPPGRDDRDRPWHGEPGPITPPESNPWGDVASNIWDWIGGPFW